MNDLRFNLMLQTLAGELLSHPPAAPGRIHRAARASEEDPDLPDLKHAPRRRDLANALNHSSVGADGFASSPRPVPAAAPAHTLKDQT